jgi:phage I-like protein
MKKKKASKELFHIFSDPQILSSEGFNPDAEFEILTSDKQYDTRYGSFMYSEKDLEEICKNFNDNVRGVEIAVDKNHDREKKAYAWIQPGAMRVGAATQLAGHFSLFCKLYRYTPEGMELMKTGAYRYFSVELMLKWTRYSNGEKTTYKNVLFGLALTNSPVVKDMKPTYSEDSKNLYTNSNNMDMFKQFLSLLKGKKIVTKDEKDTMNKMLSELSEDDREAVKDEVKEVEGKSEEDAETSEAKAKREQSEKEAKDAKRSLSETERALQESNTRLAAVEKELNKGKLEKKADAFILSETVETGFGAKDKDAVVDFMLSLSEEQLSSFESLMPKLKSLKFSATGHDSEEAKTEDAKEKEAEVLSEKILSENKGLQKWEALDQAYERLGMK